MPFRRRTSGKSPINSRKNIHQDVAIILAGVNAGFTLADAEETMPALADTNGVTVGSHINQIYLEIWLMGNAVAGVNSPVTWYIMKNIGNDLTPPAPDAAGASVNKRHIFAMGKGLMGSQANGQAGYLIRGWFKVPRTMRRMGFDDTFIVQIQNGTANDLNVCRMAIYKWYF